MRDVLGDVPVAAPEDAALAADVVVISVPDDAIASVASRIASVLRPGATVVHTSGLHGTEVLQPCGDRVAAIHPAQTIATPNESLEGVWFGVTCPEAMREWSEWFVSQLGGRAVHIAAEDRARYHAALCIASNFTVTLAGDAADLLPDAQLLAPLLRQTIQNVIELGAGAALTGPVARGDAGTIREHLRSIPASYTPAYVAMARRTLERARAAGRVDEKRAAAVEEVLEEALARCV